MGLQSIRRWGGVGALLLLFGFSAFFAARWGLADITSREVAKQVSSWATNAQTRRGSPDIGAWDAARSELISASKLQPWNPDFIERLGIMAFQRSPSSATTALPHASGLDYLRQASVLRPASPFTWAAIALSKVQIGEADAEFKAALLNAASLGPWEKDVQFVVVNLGLAFWDDLPTETQAAVKGQFVNAALRNPAEMASLAQIHGRLALVCEWPGGIANSRPCQTERGDGK